MPDSQRKLRASGQPSVRTVLLKYYDEKGFVVGSVNATEHSVMCAGSKDDEIGTFRYLMKQFPTGILSVVSDTWDLWKVLTEYLPQLKDEVLARDGKVVIRPDSGDPAHIICGNPNGKSEAEKKGVVQLLWDIFGGTTNAKGYKDFNCSTVFWILKACFLGLESLAS